MSSLFGETPVTFTQLAGELGHDVSTVFPWRLRGIRGHRLESFLLGGHRCTTRESDARFLAATNGMKAPAAGTFAAAVFELDATLGTSPTQEE
jgi:hypothetical protein